MALKTTAIVLLIVLSQVVGVSARPKEDDKAADMVAAAFAKARAAAHLSELARIDTNPFRKQVCDHSLRMPSGIIDDVPYETTDLPNLTDAARRLATSPEREKVAKRFGVGVCSLGPDPFGKMKYAVVIATYESRWTSFWRIFWE